MKKDLESADNHNSNSIFSELSEKILKVLSNLIESGVLSSKDLKKEISNELKFKKDKIVNKLELVSRQEFEILKKIVQKQDATIKKILKKKKLKR